MFSREERVNAELINISDPVENCKKYSFEIFPFPGDEVLFNKLGPLVPSINAKIGLQ